MHKITVRMGGHTGATTKDYTAQIPHISEGDDPDGLWNTGCMFGQGRAAQFEFTIVDDPNDIRTLGTDQIEAHNQVLITEDASGEEMWIGLGRIARHDAGRGDLELGDAREHEAVCDDLNIDLRGMDLVEPWVRGEETATERILALGADFFQGDPRESTVITFERDTDDHLIKPNILGGEVTMPAFTYEVGTTMLSIIEECAGVEGQAFGVVLHHEGGSHACFQYIEEDDFAINVCTLSISDHPADVDNDTVFAPIWDMGAAVQLDGQRTFSGIVTEYGAERAHYVLVDEDLVEQFDYWVEKLVDGTSTSAAQAAARAPHLLKGQSEENVNHQVTIKIPADKAHLICAGMAIDIKSAASRYDEDLGDYVTRRVAEVKLQPIAPEVGAVLGSYYAHLQLNKPEKIARQSRPVLPGPRAPTPPTEGGCTRLYLTNDAPGTALPDLDAAWNNVASLGQNALALAPSASVDGATARTEGDTNHDIALYRGSIEIDATLAAQLVAGGLTFEGHVRTKARNGIGINEGIQDHISQVVVRVTTGASTTIRGTALAAHGLTSSAGSTKWPAQSTQVNRVFPAAAATNTLSAVSGTAAGDYLVVELGYRTFNSSATPHGGGIYVMDSAASDLPNGEITTANLNSWIDLCTPGTAGDSTAPTTLPGQSTTGTNTGVYAPLDHSHEHGLLSNDGDNLHEATQIDYDGTDSGLDADTVQNAIDAIVAGIASTGATVIDHSTMGAAETFDFTDGSDHEGTLDANLTVTLDGATNGEAAFMTLVLTQDSGGGNTLDLPASVANAAEIEAAFDTTADAVNVLTVFSYDGGTTWYAFLAGGSGGGDDTMRWEAVTDGEDVFVWESDDLVHEWKEYL